MASIKDIAEGLGLSVSTVSYALNNGPKPVSPETRARVLEKARELGYRRNSVARSMITKRTNTIGVLPPRVSDDAFLSPYLHIALNGIANAAAHASCDVLLFTRYREDDPDELFATMSDRRVDGVVMIAPMAAQRSMLERALAIKLPCVVLSANSIPGIPSYGANNVEGAELAMQHLYDLGHRRIAHIAGPAEADDAIERKKGYLRFLSERGLEIRNEWIESGDFNVETGSRAFRKILAAEERPTAVFAANDEMAIGALWVANELGIAVPDSMSIVGFDATPNGKGVSPQITTVRQPIGEFSAKAVEGLLALLDGEEVSRHHVFGSELIVRGSSRSPMEEYIKQ